MNDSGSNFADGTIEMGSEGAANPGAEVRKRRSTRIVQAVPLVVTGVDALGRPFVERTSSLILNCHGCRYQSKHYVLKNMWVTLEIPHPETGQLPRTVRGRVAWIQRPRTVRQLFQVALELEVSGNVWGIAFPPEDWFAFPEGAQPPEPLDAASESQALSPAALEPEAPAAPTEAEAEPAPESANDNLRVFPSPASATDASLQLARQVARLVADARQQIITAAREAASQAISEERRLSFEESERKFAEGRAKIAEETARAIEKFQQEIDKQSREAHAAAAEALRAELPQWLGPQLEQLTRDFTSRLSQEVLAQRNEQTQQLETAAASLKDARQQAEESAHRLKTHAELVETQIAARAESAAQALEAAAKQHEQIAGVRRDALEAKATEIQQQIVSALSSAQASWREQLSREVEAAHSQLRETLGNKLAVTQDRAAGALNEHVRGLFAQLQEEMARHAAALRESAGMAGKEWEQKLAAGDESLQQHSQQLDSALARAKEASETLEHHSAQFQNLQRQALDEFQAQIAGVLSERRSELHCESQSLLEGTNAQARTAFEEATQRALEQFGRQIEEMVQPHISRAEEAIQRLAGGRSLVDAALTLQQDRIRTAADEAFAESLAQFRQNLGSVEQILQDSSQSITGRSLSELEGKVSDLRDHVVEELFKSAEWYEKKAQTQIQNHAEKAVEQTVNQLRDKAREISGVFATELDHSSRNFVGHSQTQMEDVVRDSFERARALFAEAADTTAAAFTDEIQGTARQELEGYNEELKRSVEEERTGLAQRVTAEQEDFLKRFHATLSGLFQSSVAEAQKKVSEGFAPLLEQWKSMTDAHQKDLQRVYDRMGEEAAEQYKNRMESVSNQWMLATVASLDHQSREMISGIAATAEERLREACARVFAGVGESLRERLAEIAKNFTPPEEPPTRAKSAKTGS